MPATEVTMAERSTPMKRREFYYVKKYRESIDEALQEILYELDCDMPGPDVKIILYADDKGNVEVQPEYRIGRIWPTDDDHTLHVVHSVAHGSWMMYWNTAEEIAEALDITEDELVDAVSREKGVPAADIDTWDVIRAIKNDYTFVDWRDRLVDVYTGALKENYWQEYGQKARDIVDIFIARQERLNAATENERRDKRRIAEGATALLNSLNPSRTLEVTFNSGEDELACNPLSVWMIKYYDIMPGDEYFWIYDRSDGTLLYVVNVSADSVLTSAYELYRLISNKF